MINTDGASLVDALKHFENKEDEVLPLLRRAAIFKHICLNESIFNKENEGNWDDALSMKNLNKLFGFSFED